MNIKIAIAVTTKTEMSLSVRDSEFASSSVMVTVKQKNRIKKTLKVTVLLFEMKLLYRELDSNLQPFVQKFASPAHCIKLLQILISLETCAKLLGLLGFRKRFIVFILHQVRFTVTDIKICAF